MNILFYLEPHVEMGRPDFRMGTIRNHLSSEIMTLQKAGFHVKLVMSEYLASLAKREGYLRGVDIVEISSDELSEAGFSSYQEAYACWYDQVEDYPGYHDLLQRHQALMQRKLSGFTPDVISVYEGCAPFLPALYPSALMLNNTLGILSRAPFPETSCLDPGGIYKNSFLAQFAEDLNQFKATDKQLMDLDELLISPLRDAILDKTPLSRADVRGGFSRVVMLPLQVSGYFAYDHNVVDELKGKDQIALIEYCLERIPSDVGLYVSFHGAQDDLNRENRYKALEQRYHNLLHDADTQKVRWSSQFMLPYVDGVITVSSSLGLQAMMWDKPVFVVGNSHLNFLSREHDLKAFCQHLSDPERGSHRHALFWLFSRYYPLIDQYHRDPDWYASFLRKSVDRFRRDGVDFNFFDEIDDYRSTFKQVVKGLRFDLLAHEQNRFGGHMARKSTFDTKRSKRHIAQYDTISFDIFDTLISRNVYDYNSVFDAMGQKAKAIISRHGGDAGDGVSFKSLRHQAGRLAVADMKAAGRKEITLEEIYTHVASLTKASPSAIAPLMDLEVEMELAVITPRPSGVELFEYAKTYGKRIILVSDMYLSADHIKKLLDKCEVSGWDKLYVSSEYDAVKKDGSLFEIVRDDEGGHRILHFGDNYTSDVVKTRGHNISAIHTPNINESYQEASLTKAAWGKEVPVRNLGESIHHGIISRKYFDNSTGNDDKHFASPFDLGYMAAGSIVLAFAQWILAEAKRDGVQDLYFLARDGYLIKEAYDQLVRGQKDAPRSHYLLASRRAFVTAGIVTERDLLDSLKLAFSDIMISDLLAYRFGIKESQVDLDMSDIEGDQCLRTLVSSKSEKDLKMLGAFLTTNKDAILERCRYERENINAYFDDMGVFKNSRKSIVDIGHNGSLQKYFAHLIGEKVGGYYFATFAGAKDLYNQGNVVKGFYTHFEDSKISKHPYCKNIGMFEFLFLPAIPSFECFERDAEGHYKPTYVAGDEVNRFDMIREVHAGASAYVKDFLDVMHGDCESVELSANFSAQTYIAFLEKPSFEDAMMFSNISFVDGFGGKLDRYIIALPEFNSLSENNKRRFLRSSWWREGALAIFDNETSKAKEKNKKKASKPSDRDVADSGMRSRNEHHYAIYKNKDVPKMVRQAHKFIFNREMFFEDVRRKREKKRRFV